MKNDLIRRVVENVFENINSVVERMITDSHESLWEQFTNGQISREEYQQRTERLLDSNRAKSTGCGYICVVDELTLKVRRTIEGTL
jgi:hypothetical protein